MGEKTQLRCSIGEGNDGSVRCGLKRKTIIKRLKEKYKLANKNMNEYKWMLPVKQSNITDHDWIHPKAKYHCFFNDTSLCEKYQQDQDYFETDIDYRRIVKEPELACKKCYEIWKMLN